MKKPGTRGSWQNVLEIGINLALVGTKMGAELNEMAFYHFISSITYYHCMVYKCEKI